MTDLPTRDEIVASERSDANLALLLLDAADWFNDTLLERLENEHGIHFTTNHARIFARLPRGGATPSDLARKVGVSRQSMQKLLEYLERRELVCTVPHPDDARSKIVRITETGQQLLRDAAQILVGLEEELENRIGADAVQQLRVSLVESWGERP